MTVIETENITYYYEGAEKPSMDGVSIKIRKGAFTGISPEAKFYSKASAEARKKILKRIKKSGYKTITEVSRVK